MPSEDTRILEFIQHRTSDKTSSIIYADLESLIKVINGFNNDFEKLSTTKVGEHIPCGYSVSTRWTFDGIENKHDVYRGEDCMKKSCQSLKEQAIMAIKFEKIKMITLIKEQQETYEKKKDMLHLQQKFVHKYTNDKNYGKVRDHCH